MGRMLGAFDNPEELDRPDLNKCPDCECFFAGDKCPLCGKACPEEMRAGNRKPPKKEKPRRSSSNGRVTFVEWYHSWWFITLAMFIMPIAGIILLATSPHKKSSKITFIIIGIVYIIISTIGIGTIIGALSNIFDPPVNTSLSREEYVSRCEITDPEQFYREPDAYEGQYVSMTLTVKGIITDSDGFYSNKKYTTYYICRDATGGTFEILVRNCIQSGTKNLAVGDTVTIWGEGNGNQTVYDMDYIPHTAPCINVAYIDILNTQQ